MTGIAEELKKALRVFSEEAFLDSEDWFAVTDALGSTGVMCKTSDGSLGNWISEGQAILLANALNGSDEDSELERRLQKDIRDLVAARDKVCLWLEEAREKIRSLVGQNDQLALDLEGARAQLDKLYAQHCDSVQNDVLQLQLSNLQRMGTELRDQLSRSEESRKVLQSTIDHLQSANYEQAMKINEQQGMLERCHRVGDETMARLEGCNEALKRSDSACDEQIARAESLARQLNKNTEEWGRKEDDLELRIKELRGELDKQPEILKINMDACSYTSQMEGFRTALIAAHQHLDERMKKRQLQGSTVSLIGIDDCQQMIRDLYKEHYGVELQVSEKPPEKLYLVWNGQEGAWWAKRWWSHT
jgi:chromosome segregation ATPase